MRFLSFILLFIFFSFQAQEHNALIEYSMTSSSGKIGQEIFLKIKGNTSVFGKQQIDVDKNEKQYNFKKEGNGLYANARNQRFVYKDFSKNEILSNERIVLDNYLVKDNYNIINWNILKEEKEILGYKCLKAETIFRGRNYIAYFTNTIKISDGPWKFSGLPGLILEVYSTDGYIAFNALKIEFNKIDVIINPFQSERIDYFNFQTFKEAYINRYNIENEKKMRNDGGYITTEIPKGGIEIYVE